MRVLFVHVADYLETGIPGGIATLSAVLRKEGHEIRVFDSTFLKPSNDRRDLKASPSIFKKTPYSLDDLVRDDPVSDIRKAFADAVKHFDPELLAASAMTTNFDRTLNLLRGVDPKCPVLVGGVHATISPEEVLEQDVIDMVCTGEGEGAIVDLCHALETGTNPLEIPNVRGKDNGRIFQNPPRPFEDMDRLPTPDWSVFDRRHLFRPFEGEVYTGSFITTSRGCPGACTYCVNRTIRSAFKGCGSYFRHQSPEKTVSDIRKLHEEFGANWFKFADDTFLLHSVEELEAMRDGLRGLSIKFGCSVYPGTVSARKIAVAKEMGCVAMSVGVESGNEAIRRRILNRNISNEELESAIRMILDAGIRVSTFNMIGLPGEKRENVFETIRFNKKLGVKAANVYVLYPFPGTEIARTCGTNYRDSAGRMISMSKASGFNLSCMPQEEVEGLLKTFNLYMLLPESEWVRVGKAEGQDDRSRSIFEELQALAQQFV